MNFGLLHLARPEAALAEAMRVLRPGGRYAFTVWAPPDQAVGFGMVLRAIERCGRLDVGLPEGPPFFRFSNADECRTELGRAGFVGASVRTLPLRWTLSSPDDVYEAALIDGAGEWRAFFRIMLPMARPGIAAVAIFNFLGLWNQFLLPVALNTDQSRYVLTQGMASFASQAGYAVDFGALFAAVVITVVPVLIVYVIFQRRLEGSVSRGTFR